MMYHKLGEPLTREVKRKRWAAYQMSRANHLERLAIDCSDHLQKLEIAKFAMLEFDGGPCPLCQKEWVIVEYDGSMGYCRYFQPVCDCYAVCPNCNTPLYEEHAAGVLKRHLWHCPRCCWALLVGTEKRWGAWYVQNKFQIDKAAWIKEIEQRRFERMRAEKKEISRGYMK